jgi:hypothetical protein
MTWNHRILFHREADADHGYFAVHECFYTRRGAKIPHSWTENPIAVSGDDVKEIRVTLRRMLKACGQPILMEKGEKLVAYKGSPQPVVFVGIDGSAMTGPIIKGPRKRKRK